jgi:hypothetical protein
VEALFVVVNLQVFEDFTARLGLGLEDAFGREALRFEAAKEGFSGGVVIACTCPEKPDTVSARFLG